MNEYNYRMKKFNKLLNKYYNGYYNLIQIKGEIIIFTGDKSKNCINISGLNIDLISQ
tara:strand:- start:347 stop:517 length:171 start_codon:yes stop_codon:yes gene_type:complete